MSTAYLASIEVFVGVSLLVAAWVFRRAESRLGYLAVAALAALFPAVGVPLGVGLLFSREVFSAFVVGMLAVGLGGLVGVPPLFVPFTRPSRRRGGSSAGEELPGFCLAYGGGLCGACVGGCLAFFY
jgi:hypothetical protein